MKRTGAGNGESARILPYGCQWIDSEDEAAVLRALRSEFLTQGPEVAAFEEGLSAYTGAKYTVAVANGTAALHLAVAALEIPRGSVGVTQPNTFVATGNALVYNGLQPSFVDIDPRTYVMDFEALLDCLSSREAKVVLPVHFAGQPAGLEEISRVTRRRGAYLVEDAAHAIGARYADGARVGSCRHSDMTIFSFHPVKTMTCGEGGAITTNDPELYRRLVVLRSHGITKDPARISATPGPWYYEMQTLGYNYRLTDIQAALGRSQLAKLDRFVLRRRDLVRRYNEAFSGISWLRTPFEAPGVYSAWHLYVLLFDWGAIGLDRAAVMARLAEEGIGTQVHYIPIHLQPYYQRAFGYQKGDYPLAEDYYEKALSIPLYPRMEEADQDHVIAVIKALG